MHDESRTALEPIAPFQALHDDLILCLKHNYYGTRIATAGADHKIKIWDYKSEQSTSSSSSKSSILGPNGLASSTGQNIGDASDNRSKGTWLLKDTFKAHDSSIVQVDWAHPEFGTVLLSSSFDGSAKVWSESHHGTQEIGRGWLEKARVRDGSASIRGAEFASHQFGLKFATISADGFLRIYTALDPSNLSSFVLTQEIDVISSKHLLNGPAPSKLPTSQSSRVLAAVGGLTGRNESDSRSDPPAYSRHVSREAEAGWSLSWIKDAWHGEAIAVACGKLNTVMVYHSALSMASEILPGHGGPVHSVAWAPSMGRSYQLVATGCQDGQVRIFKLHPGSSAEEEAQDVDQEPWTVEKIAEFDDHQSEVWSVNWNTFGNVLCSSGDDGRLRLWKMDLRGTWQAFAVVDGNGEGTN